MSVPVYAAVVLVADVLHNVYFMGDFYRCKGDSVEQYHPYQEFDYIDYVDKSILDLDGEWRKLEGFTDCFYMFDAEGP